jgi:phosphatidylethanolamine/phosphatidyl-N-methylethanolamine N-methyltransferase
MDEGQRYWDRSARTYDVSLRLLRGPLPRMLELTKNAVRGTGRVLEVAAGTGLVTPAIADVAGEVVATDYAPAMVEVVAKRMRDAGRTNVICEQADLYALRFESASFDAVVAANVLHLVPDLGGAIASLRRVLKPGGRLVVPTFCHGQTVVSSVVSRIVALSGFPGRRRFTVASLEVELQRAGLRIDCAETLHGMIPIGYVEGVFARS